MIAFIYNVFGPVLNGTVQALGYTYMLHPVRSRWQSMLLSTAVLALTQLVLTGLFPEIGLCFVIVNPASPFLLAFFFRDRRRSKVLRFCLITAAEGAAALLMLPVPELAGIAPGALPFFLGTVPSWPLYLAHALTLLTLVVVEILLVHQRPALTGFVCMQALAQLTALILLLYLIRVSLDRTTLVTLWLINCCSLCMLAAFLAVALRESRDAQLLKKAELSAAMQRQAGARVATCEQDAAEIRQDVLRQLDSLMKQIAAGQEGFPVPSTKAPLQYSPHLAVNTLLEHKQAQAASLHVRLTCRGRIDIPALSEFAMCTVVANMLDNAMSSAAEQDPWVTLDCIKRAGIRSLVCRNSVRPQSRPERRTHPGRQGLGLSIIRATTLEAGGRMYLQSTADTFSVILAFSDDAAAPTVQNA